MRKISVLFFFLCYLSIDLIGQISPNEISLTIQENQIKIGQLLEEITRQSEHDFSFNSQVLNKSEYISFDVKEASLEETLILLCEKIKADYTIIEGQIVLNFSSVSVIQPIIEEFFTISGFLADQKTGESLIGASVAIKGLAKGTFTNAFGYYALSLKPGVYTLLFSYVGYQVGEVDVVIEKDIQQNHTLPPSSLDLPEVIVGLPIKNLLTQKSLETMDLKPDFLSSLPEFAGANGIVKGLQTMPGIKTHSDGSAFFYVRGGERDQNLIIIDDAPIYNPSHLFGLYSIVVPDFTKSITVYKSDIPANIGDRLSSIISIRTKDGNLNKFEFNGAINPLLNRFSLEAPIIKKKGSIFLSFRRSNLEWLFRRNNPDADIRFQDFNFKVNYKINDKNRLFFTTISGADIFQGTDVGIGSGLRWGNFASTLRWNHIFGPKLFSNTIIYTGNFDYRLNLSPGMWQSSLGTLSLKSDFTHYINNDVESKFGIEIQNYYNTPGNISLTNIASIFPALKTNSSRKSALYYQTKWDISEKISFNAGLRLVNWTNIGPKIYFTYNDDYEVVDSVRATARDYNSFANLDPRLSIEYQLDNTSQLKFSFGRYHQYLQMISNSISPFTALEIWLPSNPNIEPQSANQIALNYSKYIKKSKLEFSASTYYKQMKNQIEYEPHAVLLANPLLEGELRFGSSYAYGIEFLLKKDFGMIFR